MTTCISKLSLKEREIMLLVSTPRELHTIEQKKLLLKLKGVKITKIK